MPLGALSDLQTVVGKLTPQSYSANTYTSEWVGAEACRRVQAILNVGAMTGTSTVNAQIMQAQDASGTGAKALNPAKAITQLADTNSNTEVVISANTDQLDVENGYGFVALQVVVAAAASILSAVVLGDPSATPPTPIGSVVQVIQ